MKRGRAMFKFTVFVQIYVDQNNIQKRVDIENALELNVYF
jgi:hypothetical protein